MLVRSLAILTCIALLLAANSCSTRSVSVSDPAPQIPTGLDQLPPPGSDLPRSSLFVPLEKGVSKLATVLGSDYGWKTDNADDSGSAVVLNSGETEFSAAVWLPYIEYQDARIPYIVPIDITINTDGGGKFWVALADFTTRSWSVAPVTYTGSETNLKIGLETNAGDIDGSFWFAIITYGGDSVTVNSIVYNLPGRLPGEPARFEEYIYARDGVGLATDIFLPAEKNPGPVPQPPYPVILMRTPYDKDAVLATEIDGKPLANFLADLNVVLIIQYFRGRLDDKPETPGWPNSYGAPSLFRDHNGPLHYDAIDTVSWIEGREFYNGDLGLTGPSALGVWIYQAAPSLGTRIAGIYPQASAGDIGDWAVRRNGAYKIGNVNGWVNTYQYPPALVDELKENLLSDSFWNAVDFDQRAGTARAPGFHETGWWDVDVEATIKSWSELQHKGGTGAAGNQYLVIGPWSHDTFRENVVGEITFPTSPAENDATSLPTEWEGAQWLLSVLGRNPLFSLPADNVYYYMMGAEGSTTAPSNHWYSAADWPPLFSDKTYYLSDAATGLVAAKPAAGSMTYTVGPQGIPTVGGANLPESGLSTGPYDQLFAYESGDPLVLRSAALANKVSIAGPVTARLYFELTDQTEAVDTNICVKLIDEYPGGQHMLVADSAVRLSWYLDHLPVPQNLTPGTVYQVDIEVGQRAYVFEAGHKIGLDVQGSNVFRFDENPGDGTVTEQHKVDQICKVYVGGEQASSLILPEFIPGS